MNEPTVWTEPPIHGWFGLSYASYLVLPRSILQILPHEWQQRLVDLLEEAMDLVDYMKMDDNYAVQLRGGDGKFKKDPLCPYRHGNKLAESLIREPANNL